jgi:hypothetical protein
VCIHTHTCRHVAKMHPRNVFFPPSKASVADTARHCAACRYIDSVCMCLLNSSFKERQRGFNMVWSDSDTPNQLAYEASWRTIMPEKGSFAAVPTEASHSFKSSLKHTYTIDTRDDTRMPTEGMLLRCTNELAGLGGDVKFLKQQIEMQAHVPTTIGATLSVCDRGHDHHHGVVCVMYMLLQPLSSLCPLSGMFAKTASWHVCSSIAMCILACVCMFMAGYLYMCAGIRTHVHKTHTCKYAYACTALSLYIYMAVAARTRSSCVSPEKLPDRNKSQSRGMALDIGRINKLRFRSCVDAKLSNA